MGVFFLDSELDKSLPTGDKYCRCSYIGKKSREFQVCVTIGLIYALGRMSAYYLVSLLIPALFYKSEVSFALQNNATIIIAPIVTIIGLVFLGIKKIIFAEEELARKFKDKQTRWEYWARRFSNSSLPCFLPGLCRVFFAALPVIGFSTILNNSANLIGKAFKTLGRIE